MCFQYFLEGRRCIEESALMRLESCLTASWRLAIMIHRFKSWKQSLLRDLTLQNVRLVELWYCEFLITSFKEMNLTWKRLILMPIYYLHRTTKKGAFRIQKEFIMQNY